MTYPTLLLYIDTRRGYYARYADRKRTHALEIPDVRMPQYLADAFRTAPELWIERLKEKQREHERAIPPVPAGGEPRDPVN